MSITAPKTWFYYFNIVRFHKLVCMWCLWASYQFLHFCSLYCALCLECWKWYIFSAVLHTFYGEWFWYCDLLISHLIFDSHIVISWSVDTMLNSSESYSFHMTKNEQNTICCQLLMISDVKNVALDKLQSIFVFYVTCIICSLTWFHYVIWV